MTELRLLVHHHRRRRRRHLTDRWHDEFLSDLVLSQELHVHHDVIAYGHDVLMFNAQLSPKR